jgi:DNA repair protein RecO
VAKGARRARSRYVGALEPMTRAGVAYYEREQRDLVRLNYVEAQRSPLSGASSEALGHVGYFAELIDEWAPEAQVDERLYRLGSSVVDAIAGGAPVEALARYFEYWILRLQGVYPSFACAACAEPLVAGAVMPLRDGLLICPVVRRHGTQVSVDALKFLKAAGATAPDRLETLPLDPRVARAGQCIGGYCIFISKGTEISPGAARMRHAR